MKNGLDYLSANMPDVCPPGGTATSWLQQLSRDLNLFQSVSGRTTRRSIRRGTSASRLPQWKNDLNVVYGKWWCSFTFLELARVE